MKTQDAITPQSPTTIEDESLPLLVNGLSKDNNSSGDISQQLLHAKETHPVQILKYYRFQDVLQTVTHFIMFFSFGIAVSLLGPTLKDLARNCRTSQQDIGWVFTAKGLGGVLGSMIGGKFYDFFQSISMRATHVFLVFSAFVLSACLASFPLITKFWMMLIAFGVFGMAVGLVNMGTNILCMWTWKEKVTPIILAISCTAGIGNFMGPLLISMGLSFEMTYYVAATIVALAGILLYFGQTFYTCLSDEQDLAAEKEKKAKSEQQTQSQAIEASSDGENKWKAFMEKTKEFRVAIVIGFALFGAVGLESCMGGLAFSYIENEKLAKSERENALMSSTFWVSLMAGRLAASFISSFISPTLILLTNIVCSVLSIAIFILMSAVSLPYISVLWLAIILMGIGVSSQFPTAMSYPTTSMSNMRVTGVMSSIMIVMASSAEMTVPLIITRVFGVHRLFWILLIVWAISAIAYFSLFSWAFATNISAFFNRKKQQDEEHEPLRSDAIGVEE